LNPRIPLLGLVTVLATFAAASAATAEPSPRTLLAQRFDALAREAMQGAAEADAPALTQALILLERAAALDPDDAERWHLRAQALRLAGDTAALTEALKRYVALRPDDDVAQLELVRLLAARRQTAEAKVDYYLRIIEGRFADRFSAPLRSRLAYEAAVLQRQRGETEPYLRLLGRALSLDGTNKAAAAESFQALNDDPDASLSERAAALFTLFNADPTDLEVRQVVAESLMGLRLYDEAAAWLNDLAALQREVLGSVELGTAHDRVLALWGAGRSDEALALLARISRRPDAPASEGAADEAPPNGEAGAAPPAETPPAPDAAPQTERDATAGDWPPVETLLLRLAIARSLDQADLVRPALEALHERLAADPEPEDSTTGRVQRLNVLIWAHLLAGEQLDRAAALIDRLVEAEPGAEPETLALALWRGWLALHRGDRAEARRLLEPLADADPRARLVLAETLDDPEARREQWRRVIERESSSLTGLLAVARLRQAEALPPVSTEARRTANLFAEVPEHLQRVWEQPMQFVQMNLKPIEYRSLPPEPIEITIELRNVYTEPLGLGPDATLPSRVLLVPTVRYLDGRAGRVEPIVVDMRRRLTPPAQHSVAVTTRVDVGQLGAVLEASPNDRIQINISAVLNPQISPEGVFVPGLLGSTQRLGNLARQSAGADGEQLDPLLEQMRRGQGTAAMVAAARLLPTAAELVEDRPSDAERLAAAAVEVWPDLSIEQRAWVLSFLAPEGSAAPLFAELRRLAGQSDDPLVQLTLLATQVTEPDDPLLNQALRGEAGPLKRFAEARRRTLQQQAEREAAAREEPAAAPNGPAAPPMEK